MARRILSSPDGQSPASWKPLRVLGSITDARAVAVGPLASEEQAIVKFGVTQLGSASVDRAADSLELLANDPRLVEWRRMTPELLGRGRIGDSAYVIERIIKGVRGDFLSDGTASDQIMMHAARAARELNLLTLGEVGGAAGWFEERIGTIRTRLVGSEWSNLSNELEGVASRLAPDLDSVPAAMAHGDYWLGNLIFDGETSRLAGIVDWDAQHSAAPVDLDLISLLIASRVLRTGRETGQVVASLLAEEPWDDTELSLLETAVHPQWAVGSGALSVAWLHSVALLLEQSQRYQPGSPWFLRNFSSILPILMQKVTPQS